MWKLSEQNLFLFYNCAPEMVVYNKSNRSTSLLSKILVNIFSLFQSCPENSFGIETIQSKVFKIHHLKIDEVELDNYLNDLQAIKLIEFVKCE